MKKIEVPELERRRQLFNVYENVGDFGDYDCGYLDGINYANEQIEKFEQHTALRVVKAGNCFYVQPWGPDSDIKHALAIFYFEAC